MANEKGIKTQVTHKPILIDPNTNPKGEEYMAYNVRRWGGDAWTQSLKRSGLSDDTAEFKSWVTWPNSLNAHTAMQFFEKNFPDR